jgi:hypothetical protein
MRERVTVERAPLAWAQALVTERHYLHKPVHPMAYPFAYMVRVDGRPAGCLIYAVPHFTRLRGLFGYPGLPDKWQVLVLSRMWLDPSIQGQVVTGRDGRRHSLCVASCALAQSLRRVQRDWLLHHPPRFLDQPYHIRLVITWADEGAGHKGTVYRACNWRFVKASISKRGRHGQQVQPSRKLLFVYELPEPRWSAPFWQPRLLAEMVPVTAYTRMAAVGQEEE